MFIFGKANNSCGIRIRFSEDTGNGGIMSTGSYHCKLTVIAMLIYKEYIKLIN